MIESLHDWLAPAPEFNAGASSRISDFMFIFCSNDAFTFLHEQRCSDQPPYHPPRWVKARNTTCPVLSRATPELSAANHSIFVAGVHSGLQLSIHWLKPKKGCSFRQVPSDHPGHCLHDNHGTVLRQAKPSISKRRQLLPVIAAIYVRLLVQIAGFFSPERGLALSGVLSSVIDAWQTERQNYFRSTIFMVFEKSFADTL